MYAYSNLEKLDFHTKNRGHLNLNETITPNGLKSLMEATHFTPSILWAFGFIFYSRQIQKNSYITANSYLKKTIDILHAMVPHFKHKIMLF